MAKWRPPPGWEALRQDCFGRYGHVCHWCGGWAGTVDHLIPVCLGGTHDPANLRPACTRCNCRNGAIIGNKLRGRRLVRRIGIIKPINNADPVPFTPSRDW